MKQGADAVLRRCQAGWIRQALLARGHDPSDVELALAIVALLLGRPAEANELLLANPVVATAPERQRFEHAFYRGVAR